MKVDISVAPPAGNNLTVSGKEGRPKEFRWLEKTLK